MCNISVKSYQLSCKWSWWKEKIKMKRFEGNEVNFKATYKGHQIAQKHFMNIFSLFNEFSCVTSKLTSWGLCLIISSSIFRSLSHSSTVELIDKWHIFFVIWDVWSLSMCGGHRRHSMCLLPKSLTPLSIPMQLSRFAYAPAYVPCSHPYVPCLSLCFHVPYTYVLLPPPYVSVWLLCVPQNNPETCQIEVTKIMSVFVPTFMPIKLCKLSEFLPLCILI